MFLRYFLFLLLLLLIAFPAILFFRSEPTTLQFVSQPRVVGVATPVKVLAANPHGFREFHVTLKQGGKSYAAFARSADPIRWSLFRNPENPRTFEFDIGSKVAPGLRDGNAQLIVETVANDFRARRDLLTADIEVNTQPPALSVDGGQHYINLGGSEIAVFNVSGYWTEAGVRVGKYTFRSFPLGGDKNRRVSIFAFPHDTPEGVAPVVFVRNPSGAEANAQFWHKITRKRFRERTLDLGDGFLQKIFTELDPGGSGDTVARFVKINHDMRQANSQALADLRMKTADKILWNGPFLQLANSSVEAQFCDYRNYAYRGQVVDKQVHLGFDLAVTANTAVVAANDGSVVHAAPLGIYGNAIVVDHGLGLQSLYAHLSRMEVKPGDSVKKGQTIGRSGATGLAGGDHLHFGMQVDGVSVNPVEWWDGHWIQDRILAKLGK